MLKKWNEVPVAVKASTTYTVCSILQKCLSFVTLPLFTRLLTTEQYGQYTVYTSWSSIFTIFITFCSLTFLFSFCSLMFYGRGATVVDINDTVI